MPQNYYDRPNTFVCGIREAICSLFIFASRVANKFLFLIIFTYHFTQIFGDDI